MGIVNATRLLSSDSVLRNPGILVPLLYIFVAIIPHAVAPRYILAGTMLLVLLYQALRGQLQKPPLDFVSVAVFALSAITLLSAALSPYYAESLPLLRKETAPFLVGFLLLVCQPLNDSQRRQCIRYVFTAVILGFSIKLMLALGDGVRNDWKFVVYDYPAQQKPRYLDFFAADIYFYLPFLLTPLLFWKMNLGWRLLLGVVTAITLWFAINSGVRTTLVLVVLSTAFYLTIRFWAYKKWLLMILMVAVAGAYLAKGYVTHPEKSRYYAIFSSDTYALGKDGSISERQAIARSIWQINKNRLWLGYGPDWKKIPIVAEQYGYTQSWNMGSEPWHPWAAKYFAANTYGQVNPHNLYLMVMFEVGLLGLAIYLLLMLSVAFRGAKTVMSSKSHNLEKSVGLTVLVYVGAYLASGFTGGPWLPVGLLVAAWLSELTCCGSEAH